MSLFCLLWVPLFYLFRRSITGEGGAGGVWALLLGSITAIFQFTLGYLVIPGGFGFSRWVSAFVDIVSIPVLIPLLVYVIFIVCRVFSSGADFANFALLWLIPVAALRAISWSSQSDPLLLVIVPLLWTAIAVGIPFFINCIMRNSRWHIAVPSGLAILVLPFLAATAYWAFFSQQPLLGFALFLAALIPMVISVVLGASSE
ncbi:hypothetical protein AGMMS50293_30180 [Spirochaetia bacterium]|nr:hypothetical protein AGMMS50293_30180 [Spirochaetia bacterium]